MQLPKFQNEPPGSSSPSSDIPRRLKRVFLLAALLAAVVAAAFLLEHGKKESKASASNMKPLEISETDFAEIQRGYELSRTVCSACHLYPEPDLMDKFTWTYEVLPKMAFWLGFESYDFETEPGGERVKQAQIMPAHPMIPFEDWKAICNYYAMAAPLKPVPQAPREKIEIGLPQFQVLIPPYPRKAKNTMVHIDSKERKLYVGNAEENTLDLLDANGVLLASFRADSPPSGLIPSAEGLLVTLIGSFTPSDEPTGQVVFVENPREGEVTARPVLKDLQRPTSTTIADLNNDGRPDLVITQFGHILGRFGWFENLGNNQYREHVLLDRSGAIKAFVHDFNKDGRPDIVALMAQSREGIYLFLNDGKGGFVISPVVECHPSWGFSSFELVDFNGDGHMDILATNGDNGETIQYAHPMKNYHGIRLYLNDGKNAFQEAFFYPLNGAYKAVARDFNGNGRMDIAAISYFPNYERSPAESFVYLENKGGLEFDVRSFPESISGRWIVMDTGDIDGDGDEDIVLGGYLGGPGMTPAVLAEQWELRGSSILILKNNLRQPARQP